MRHFMATLSSLGSLRFRQVRFALAVLALCAFACLTHLPAFGQSQLAAAETCFDQEPGVSPAVLPLQAPVPQIRNRLSERLDRLEAIFRARQVKSQPAKAAPAPSEEARVRNRLIAELKNSEGPLTGLR
jgi:hypothetical protein